MRRGHRVDANQAEIVEALRAAGRTVQVISQVGKGCPDLAVGLQGRTFLLEVKVPGAKLTEDERRWHLAWRGQVAVVTTPQEAIEATR